MNSELTEQNKEKERLLSKLKNEGEPLAFKVLFFSALIFWLLAASFFIYLPFHALTILLLISFIVWAGEKTALAELERNSVRVSEKQFGEIYSLFLEAAERLSIPDTELPLLFIKRDDSWNSFSMNLCGKKVVVLHSGLLDTLEWKKDPKRLLWITGHELGHHILGHISFFQKFLRAGAWFPWAYFWFRREMEFSADRCGLYCANDLEASLHALSTLLVGKSLAPLLNRQVLIDKWERIKNEPFVKGRERNSLYPSTLARISNLAASASLLE